MFSRRHHKATGLASWLAIIAILFQALLPPLQHQASLPSDGHANTPPAGLTLAGFDLSEHICLSPGSNTPGEPDKAPQHHTQPCGLCIVMHSVGGFPPSTPVVAAIDRRYAAFAPALAHFTLPRQRLDFHRQPRGPPNLA